MTMRLRSSSMRSRAARLSLFSSSVRFVSSSICSWVRPYSSLHFWCKSFFLLSFRSSSDESGCGAVICGFKGERHEHKTRGVTQQPTQITLPKSFLLGRPRFLSNFSSIRNASSGSSELLSCDSSSSEMSLSSSSDSNAGRGEEMSGELGRTQRERRF